MFYLIKSDVGQNSERRHRGMRVRRLVISRSSMIKYNSCCLDCNLETIDKHFSEYYMVQHDVWKLATKPSERQRLLCIKCLESRLGRELNGKDFLDCPLNKITKDSYSSRTSVLLLNRLNRVEGR